MRLVIADDSVLLREGLIRLLEEEGHEVLAAAEDGEGLLAAVAEHEPDAAVVDVRMPPTHTDEGLRAALSIRAERPEGAVLVLSQYVDQRVAAGGAAFDPEVVRQLLARTTRTDPLARLTPRERDVLENMAQGLSNAAIAERLFVSLSAVEKHINAIFDKLDLARTPEYSRRVLAVLRFLGS
ncbi:MAG: response regulator transcription factor [Nocardiopsis sp. BM-2018]|nr:MAG: response regulator transcription factor [Nocardiopsis sp. BM-2018]